MEPNKEQPQSHRVHREKDPGPSPGGAGVVSGEIEAKDNKSGVSIFAGKKSEEKRA